MIRRRIVLFYWIIAVTLFIPTISYAYIDPATTTYIIQIVTALVITLGVTMSIALYKMKMVIMNLRILFFELRQKFFSKKQREEARITKDALKQNAQKDEEGLQYGIPKPRSEYAGVVPLPPISEDDSKSEEPKRKGIMGILYFLFHDDRKFTTRLVISLLVAAMLPFTVIIFGILDLVITNHDVVTFPYQDILSITLKSAGKYFLAAFACLIIWRGRAFDWAVCFGLGLSVATYLQGTFMNRDLGQLTGDAIPWDEYATYGTINAIVWVLIFIAVFALRFASFKIWSKAVYFIPSIILAVQLVALVSIMPSQSDIRPDHPKAPPHIIDRLADQVGIDFKTPEEKKEEKEKEKGKESKPIPPHEIIEAKYGKLAPGEEYSITRDGIYDVSSGENIFFFILDRFDMVYAQDVLDDDPTFFDDMAGFTMFTNNISEYSRTFPSVASTLTGRLHMFDIPATQYFSEAYAESSFIFDIQDAGYTTKLYMERPYTFTNTEQLFGLAENIGPAKLVTRVERSYELVERISFFRYAPHNLKRRFFSSPHEFGKTRTLEASSGSEPYVTNDFKFHDDLVKQRLKITTDKGNFAFYHLLGPHTPYNLTENIELVPWGTSNALSQSKGSFRIVFEFMEQLKELGIYENSTIIITADHGIGRNRVPLDRPMRSILFVKPSGKGEGALEYSEAPVFPDNLRATVIEATGTDHSSYGRTYFEVPEDDPIVREYYYRLNEIRTRGPILEKFEVRGDSSDFGNWKKIEDIAIKYWFG